MGAAQQELIAIDVLLVPDRATIDKSMSLNAQLRTTYPAGYALDAMRIPHVTLLQRFVPAKDFEAVCATASRARKSGRRLGCPHAG